MGVRGLLGYMEENRKQFFKDLKLKNTTLIIDGCNFYFNLYFSSPLDQQHGGDYDAFAKLIREFFKVLSTCNIKPIVLLDGGVDYTNKKFQTRQQRAQNNIEKAVDLSHGLGKSLLPLLTKEVFKEVLHSLHVPFIQCVNEADWEIACLASEWNYPVLSADSDFFVFDLKGGYLPFQLFQWCNIRECPETSERYIPASCFSIDNFCARFNKMNKELLPLFAVMAGNDFTNLGDMRTFFSRVNVQGSGHSAHGRTRAQIDVLLCWLSKFPGPEQALDAVVQVLWDSAQDSIRPQLSSGMQEYRLSPSNLPQYFTHGEMVPNLPEPLRDLPNWVLVGLLSGDLPSIILEVLAVQMTMMRTQVEDPQRPSSHTASLPIRKVLYGLLLHGKSMPLQEPCTKKKKIAHQNEGSPHYHVREFDREGLNLKEFHVQPDLPSGIQHLPLKTLNEVPLPDRLQVLLKTLKVDESIANAVLPHLSLPVCVTCYWLNCSEPKPDLHIVQALLLGIVYGELCRTQGPEAGDPDLQAVCDRLGRLRVAVRERKELDLKVAHAYSQWQSCLWMSFYLNQLLQCPLPEPECAWLYSGTFAHGAVKKLRTGIIPEVLLGGAGVPARLYETIQWAVQRSVGTDFFTPPSRRQNIGAGAAVEDK
ncbi:protein asteroid homolog 1-like [Anguilla anguilla]|uniref:protein asteroid homolog 1-like n=1 Tax=Anguilla anguilla TaxID=7936 RepID=UPI0015AF4450|nr:protein asteroid homolog 1-like [Anguilla anguilla]